MKFNTKVKIPKTFDLDVSKNRGKTPPNHPFVHRVFHEINHPFWRFLPIFGNTHFASWNELG